MKETLFEATDLANWVSFLFGMPTRSLFFLPRCAKPSPSNYKSFSFVALINFLNDRHSFAQLVRTVFLKPLRTAG